MVSGTARQGSANQHRAGGRRAPGGLALGGLALGGLPRAPAVSVEVARAAPSQRRAKGSSAAASRPLPGCLPGRTEVGARRRLYTEGVSSFTHKRPKPEHRLSLKSWKDSRDAVHATERDSGIERGELLTPAAEAASPASRPPEGDAGNAGSGCALQPSGRPGDACQLLSAEHPPDGFQSRGLFFCGWAPVSVPSPSLAVLGPWCWASQERVWTWWWSKPLHPVTPGTHRTLFRVDCMLGHETVLSKS